MNNLILCILTAICFAIWPILLNKSATPNMPLATIIVMISTLLPMIIHNTTASQKFSLPSKYIWIALLIGLVNGIGMIFYSKLINTSNAGVYVSIVATFMPICALILGYFILGQPTITLTKIAGISLAIIGVWLLTK